MSETLFPVPSVKVSARWLATRLNCTYEGITGEDGCGGCCSSDEYWPPSASTVTREYRGVETKTCPHLGPGSEGCTLGARRPLKCHLYPLELSATSLRRRWHSVLPHSLCACNHGYGPSIAEAFEESFRVLFPVATVDAILDAVRTGADVSIDLPRHVVEALEREERWEADNVVPEPTDWPDPNAPPRRATAP